jgi:hypothetical protein
MESDVKFLFQKLQNFRNYTSPEKFISMLATWDETGDCVYGRMQL